MDISENDIEWTTGTDKPYGQTVFEQWQKSLSDKPKDFNSEGKTIYDLKEAIKHFEHRINEFDEEINNPNTVQSISDLEYLKHEYKDAVDRLNELYNQHTEASNKTDGRETRAEKQAIQKFWRENKAKYLIEDNKLNGYYNASEIARQVKNDGDFSSSLSTIKDHANLHDL